MIILSLVSVLAITIFLGSLSGQAQTTAGFDQSYQHEETRELVALVKDAAELVRTKGEAAFNNFRLAGSRWRQGEAYIFVLDPRGNMLVHPDPGMEGRNELELKDINGKPIIRGLIGAATTLSNKPEGWYHYQWPVPGGLLPRWKSTYVRLAVAPSGKSYVVGSGVYNDRMERAFVVDLVKDAVGQIEKGGKAAFPLFHDPKGPFMAKDSYIFVIDRDGTDLSNPGFPNLEGRNQLNLKDTQGKQLIREMLNVVQTSGSGWVDYMWPKAGESVSTQKSTYVSRAKMGDQWVMVGCGVYLADAPKAISKVHKMTAPELMTLVRDGAAIFEKQGEKAFPGFRNKGSRWFRDDTYFFVLTMDGILTFHAAEPAIEGRDDSGIKDVLGRPFGKMILEAAGCPAGEGWVHYMYPEPGDIFPKWKSAFVKRMTLPSGKQYVIGSGIYNMQMDKAFVEDVVNRAAALVADRGKEAFGLLRDKKGPFVFMDTYVFLDTPNGTELVNAAQPSIEGKNIIDERDAKGKALVQEYIGAALKNGSAWVGYYWYKPGNNVPVRKLAFVRKVQSDGDTYIVGSGLYLEDEAIAPELDGSKISEQRRKPMSKATEKKISEIQKMSWKDIEKEKLSDQISLQKVFGEKGTMAKYFFNRGNVAARHSHVSEEYMWITSGALKYIFDDREVVVNAGEFIVVPPNTPHSLVAFEETMAVGFFAPRRDDWLRGEDKYLRQ